ncbi:MAG: cupredoxin domain-containing protein [Candidatus Limnocylindrales bacterium]
MRLGFALFLASCLAVAGCRSTVTPSRSTVTPAPSTARTAPEPPASVVMIVAGGDADVYHYDPPTLTVRANTQVEVQFVDRDVVDHTWTVFDSDGTTILANLAVAKEGDEATGTFTFARAGTYPFWCTIPGHKAFGEVGTLTVTP